ncbi:MAG: hydantoinase B/oxoprolinase family protein, partial [Nitratireductor sp.]
SSRKRMVRRVPSPAFHFPVPPEPLEEMECAILSSHRQSPPRGAAGGGDGQVGKTEVRRADGTLETLKACDQTVIKAGEAVIVTTPTAGGFGRG